MGMTRRILISLLIGLSLILGGCDPGDPGLPHDAQRQVQFLAAEGSTITSAQLAPDGFLGQETWCVVTRSDEGAERWLLFRVVEEGQRDLFKLTVPAGPPDFAVLGCTNWDD